jgi:MoxR-like ATPase
LDRFLFKIVVGYPAPAEEIDILRGHHQRGSLIEAIDAVRPVLDAGQLASLRGQVHQVHVEDNLFSYIAQIVQATRANKSLYLGASPRASLALLNSAKALATLRGRDFITPEDVQFLAAPVLRHRVLLTPDREMEGGTADDVIAQVVQKIEVPR